MDEFRLNKLGLGVSAQNLRALGDDGGPSASASTSEVREANEQDEFISVSYTHLTLPTKA